MRLIKEESNLEKKRPFEVINLKSSRLDFGQIIVIAVLTLFFMQVGYVRDSVVILFLSILCLICVYRTYWDFHFERETVLLLCFLSYGSIIGDYVYAICCTLVIVVMSIMTKFLTRRFNNSVKVLVITLVGGYTIHAILNASLVILEHRTYRMWKDFFTGVELPSTQHVIYFLPIFALLIPILFNNIRKRYTSVLIIIIVAADVIFSVANENRMVPVILLVCCIIEFAYMLLLKKDDKAFIKNASKKFFLVTVFLSVLLLIVIGIVALYRKEVLNNLINVMNRDGGLINNVRFRIQWSAITQMFKYPMGGNHMDLLGYSTAHNVWLDMVNTAGLIPFAFFMVYTIISLYDLIKYLRNIDFNEVERCVVLGLYVIFVLYYLVEPALIATYYFIVPWVFINGIVAERNRGANIRYENIKRKIGDVKEE